jgi:hypothetical protein
MWLRAGELGKRNATTGGRQTLSGTDIDEAAKNVSAKLMDEKIRMVKKEGLRRSKTIKHVMDLGLDHDEAVEATLSGTIAENATDAAALKDKIGSSAGSGGVSKGVLELAGVPEFESGDFQAFAQSVDKRLAELTLAVRQLELGK